MKSILLKFVPCLALLFVLNGVDYDNLGDWWNDGKVRYLLLALVPVVFVYFHRKLGAPAFVGALALLSWTLHGFKPSHNVVLPVIVVLGALYLSSVFVQLGQKVFGDVLIFSGVLQGTIAILQAARAAHLLPFGFWHHARPDGLIGNHTLLASFLVVCLAPALFRGTWWATLAALVMLPAILACHSVGGLVCLCVLVMVWASQWRNFINWPYLVFLCALAASIGAQALYHRSLLDSDGRTFMWGFGWEAVKEHPWFGGGIGVWDQTYLPRFAEALKTKFNEAWHVNQIHNDYLDFAIEYGLVSLGLLSLALPDFVLFFRATWYHAVCVVLLVDALFSFPSTQLYTAIPFVCCWAFARNRKSIIL